VGNVSRAEEGKDGRQKTGRTISVAYRLIIFWWLFVAFAGFAIALAGVAALQHKVNRDHNTHSWSVRANYPDVVPHRVFSFDWYVVFLQLVLFVMVTIAAPTSTVIQRARVALVGLLAAGAVLNSISADRMYNVRAFRNFSSSTAAFVGFLLSALADYCLVYMLGIDPSPPPDHDHS